MKSHIVPVDPCKEIDEAEVDKVIKKMQLEEEYVYERDHVGFGEVLREQFNKIVNERYLRIRLNKKLSDGQERLGFLRDFIAHLESEKKEIQDKNDSASIKCRKTAERDEKLKFNFEVVCYMKQGQVEVPQLPVATDYKDAILISR